MIILGCACGGIGELILFFLATGVVALLGLFGIKLGKQKEKQDENICHRGRAREHRHPS
jgi:hypothetical protein